MHAPNIVNTPVSKPEFIRIPRAGERCPYTGLSRAWIYEAANAGLIRTVSIRSRGRVRGVRLIDYDSLVSYLRSQSDQKAGAA